MKLFRASKAPGAAWSTTVSVTHSQKKHVDSKVARQQKGRAEKTWGRRMNVGEENESSEDDTYVRARGLETFDDDEDDE